MHEASTRQQQTETVRIVSLHVLHHSRAFVAGFQRGQQDSARLLLNDGGGSGRAASVSLALGRRDPQPGTRRYASAHMRVGMCCCITTHLLCDHCMGTWRNMRRAPTSPNHPVSHLTGVLPTAMLAHCSSVRSPCMTSFGKPHGHMWCYGNPPISARSSHKTQLLSTTSPCAWPALASRWKQVIPAPRPAHQEVCTGLP